MYSTIIIWKNNCTRQTQYSFQQIPKASHTFPHPTSKILTMTSNKLWNVNTLELPSTITAPNGPSSSTATILRAKIKVLKETQVTKSAELIGFQSDHEDLETKSKETQALLDKDEAILQKLATNTQTLLAATIREKATLTKIIERIDTLLETAAPLHDAIKKLETQLDKKVTEANKAKQLEDTAALSSKIQLDCHRTSGKGFIKAMKDWYNYSNWKSTKSTKDNRNIGPQTETILLALFHIPCFFSRTELKVFLGYTSPNHNVNGDLTKMVEENCSL
jgi:multidrug efflux pump subunit AcrA (membrane-fusion protein)